MWFFCLFFFLILFFFPLQLKIKVINICMSGKNQSWTSEMTDALSWCLNYWKRVWWRQRCSYPEGWEEKSNAFPKGKSYVLEALLQCSAMQYINSEPLLYVFHPTNFGRKKKSFLICTKWDPFLSYFIWE